MREVKMAEYWSSSFLCVFMDQKFILAHIMASGKFFLRDPQVVLSRQDIAILSACVVNHSTEFGSFCPLMLFNQLKLEMFTSPKW